MDTKKSELVDMNELKLSKNSTQEKEEEEAINDTESKDSSENLSENDIEIDALTEENSVQNDGTVEQKNKTSLSKLGKILILVGLVGLVIGLIIMLNRSNNDNSNTANVSEVVEVTTSDNNSIKTEEVIDIDKELEGIVDSVVGKSNCTTKDADKLWQLYLLSNELEQYAVYVDIKDNKLDAVVIAKPNDVISFDSSISLVKSGFIGGLGDNNNIVVTKTYSSNIGDYRVITFGDKAIEYGKTITDKLNKKLEGSK